MKKRGLASLLIVSIIAIAAVFGVVFAFQNAGLQKDVYGSVTVSVDKPNVQLEIELEKDVTSDNGFKIKETELNSTFVTVTVGGVPDSGDRRALVNPVSINNGVVVVTPVTSDEEADKTGVNVFLIEGKNPGNVGVEFVAFGGRTVTVNVVVDMQAQDMRIETNSHFGIQQSGSSVDLNSSDILSKYVFLAHADANENTYKPNIFPVEYRLKRNYQGVGLENGVLSVSDSGNYANQTIEIEVKLPTMDYWLTVPFYVFPSVNKIHVESNAFQSKTTENNPKIWDLIANRTEKSSANFVFSLEGYEESDTFYYGFEVTTTDGKVVKIDNVDRHTRTLTAGNSLGEVAVSITAYPIVKENGKEIYYNTSSDANVQVKDIIYIRVRNEFNLESEAGENDLLFNLAPSKKDLYAFYYEGNINNYYDTFALDTANGKSVNVDADIKFELDIYDGSNKSTVTYDEKKIFNYLKICYWSSAKNDWVALSETNYSVNYLNNFSVALTHSTVEKLLHEKVKLVLRIKSINELSVGGYATCSINLNAISAIDCFNIDGLTQFSDGKTGIALVYNTIKKEFVGSSIDVFGQYAKSKDVYENSQFWDPTKVLINESDLPFQISSAIIENQPGVKGRSHVRYDITATNISEVEYYNDYNVVVSYVNGVSVNFVIRVYPTIDQLSMSVVSSSKGKIYQTIMNDNNSRNYNYVRTVYVRKGYTYELAIDTPNVSVGAYSVFDQVYDENDKPISQVSSDFFDARNLKEGLYECYVSLHAYSNDVYGDNQRDNILVYVIVVDPVGNVTLPREIVLDGAEDSTKIQLMLKTLDNQDLNDYRFLNIDLAQTNDNVLIEQDSNYINQFNIEAKYLAEESFEIGFVIYKTYEFDDEKFNLDGNWTPNESFRFDYIGGSLVTIKVTIKENQRYTVCLTGYDNNKSLGDHLSLISGPDEVKGASIGYSSNSSDDQSFSKYGITYAKWENGKYNLSAFAPLSYDNILDVDGYAIAKFDTESGKINVVPTANATSLGKYALVVYTRESLYFVENKNQIDLVLPKTYTILPIYIGQSSEINNLVEELVKGITHDANSGKINDRGGYNWVLPSQNPNIYVATLFYTRGTNVNTSANIYYLDDLYTVLGEAWWPLKNTSEITITKFVDNVKVVSSKKTKSNDISRLSINLNEFNDSQSYSTDDVVVYYEVVTTGGTMKFYVAESVNVFEIAIETKLGNSGLVSRKNLSPDEYTNNIDSITVQRGNEFWFNDNLNRNSGWKLYTPDFDTIERSKTAYTTYNGGVYSFNPYIEFDGYRFDLYALKATINVNVKGGVNYLNIAQNSITLDGVTTANFDLTVRVDQKPWSVDLLKYNFLYDGVYYDLFVNNEEISDVVLAGGKAKLQFKLSCLNSNEPPFANSYYTYYLRIEVAVIIITPDVDPFYDISGARLIVKENLNNSALIKTKTAVSDSASLNLAKQGIYNITLSHFAETNVVKDNKSSLTLVSGQSNAGVIYIDGESAGGLLVVYPTPYYINVYSMSLWTSQSHTEKVLIGNDLSGNPIYDTVTYSIGFTQMVYNEREKCFQPYVNTSDTPKMVSTWSPANGYQWDGKYYFKTYIISSSQVSHRLTDGTRFTISISMKAEDNAQAITESLTIDAKYHNSFVVDADDDTEDYMVCTMSQTRYQALGTTAVYDIAMPSDCVPNYSKFTFNGVGTATKSIELSYATVTINSVSQTLSVYLKADAASIGASLEIRIPYTRPGDYVNPYLSVVIVPVYFEFSGIEVIDHYESTLQLSQDEIRQLQFRGLFNYSTNMSSNSLTDKINTFNNNLKSTSRSLLGINYETAGEITVQVPYSYVNGVPVITKDGTQRYSYTFKYEVVDVKDALVKRTEYLAVGTSSVYTFNNWDSLYSSQLYLDESMNNTNIKDFWKSNLSAQGNTISISVSLENRNSLVSNNEAYKSLINAGKIIINVFSNSDRINPQMELTIIPVYFTFSEFKLYNNPVNPLVALSTPTQLTFEAGKINSADDVDVTNAINNFNQELLNIQNNLSSSTLLSFSRVPNEDGVMNFNFDVKTRTLTRSDILNPITATSFLLITANITYVNGVPTLSSNGTQITTYLPVCTFGSSSESDSNTNSGYESEPQRTRSVAQAIGTTVKYNIALSGVAYDSKLDKYEIRVDGDTIWDSNFNWNAVINLRDNTVTVTLGASTDLFDRILVVKAYNQSGKLSYVLKIIPAYFTVEQILLEDHVDEVPVMISSSEAMSLMRLSLNFTSKQVDQTFEGFDLEQAINDFYQSLNNSGLVSRIDDAGYLTLIAGINYVNGIPTLVNTVNASVTIQNTYRYEVVDGIPETTKVQALGQEVLYNVNRTVGAIRISGGIGDDGNEIWNTNYSGFNSYWWVENDYTNTRRIKVGISDEYPNSVIGERIRIGIFVNPDDEEPSYILNIIPAYFVVENITFKGQSVEDRDIYLYNGETPSSPNDIVFDAVVGEYSKKSALGVAQLVANFTSDLQSTKANLIGRYYDSSLSSGDLHITLYLDYKNGKPMLVSDSEADNEFVVRLDYDFTYAVYGRADSNGALSPMPSTPRTRTEIQAIGTSVSYTIDLDKNISMDVDDLTYNESRDWQVSLENNIVTVTLSTEESLLKQDIELNFYVEYDLVFVLTIQPVLFEVKGISTIYPEQPIDMSGKILSDLDFYVNAKYNDSVVYKGYPVITYIEALNAKINSEKLGLVEVVLEDQYIKVDVALDYGVAGSGYRSVPALLNVESYPLNVIESYLEFSSDSTHSTSASHNQAIGTTEYYHLGVEFENANVYSVSVGENLQDDSSLVSATLINYGSSYALKVVLEPKESLVTKLVTVCIQMNDGQVFTFVVKPVWFIVEGFEVVNHPERHMWLISSSAKDETINDLFFRARTSFTTNSALQTVIQNRIDTFNYQLSELINNEWTAKEWANYLETYTIGGEYLVVRGAVKYDNNGVAFIDDINQSKPVDIVRSVFKYVRYTDQVVGSGLVYPNVPRSRTVELTIGYEAEYTLDIPNLKSGFSNDMIVLYQNSDSDNADDDSSLQRYQNGTDGWSVQASGKKLKVSLDPNTDLVNRELKVFIYKDRNSVQNTANSYDVDNVAFILTIHPVWFKVTGFTLTGYTSDSIQVDNINDFMSDLTKIDSGKKFVPVYEYSEDVLKSENGATLKNLMDDFTNDFISSKYVTKTRTRSDDNKNIYYFQVTTSVNYEAFNGTAVLSDESVNRIWSSFEIKVNDTNVSQRIEYQAVGTTKIYYLDDSILDGVQSIDSNSGYNIVDWNNNYVTVELSDSPDIVNTNIRVKISNSYSFIIKPVYYEVLGFEPVEHPERSVWVLSPYTVDDLKYRVITTEISNKFDSETMLAIQNSIDNLNESLNNGNAPVSITTDNNESIVFDAAVNYDAGYPIIVEITKDKRNVVESVIPYRVWSATQKPKPEQPTTVGTTRVNQIIGNTKLYTLKNIKGQVFYQYMWTENAGSVITPFENSANGTVQVYENLSVSIDSVNGNLKVQLAANANYLSKTIRIYLPYLTTVNGENVWYSHCIEITPLLFELKGWTIEADSLMSDGVHDDYLLLSKNSDVITRIKYVAKINACVTTDADLLNRIAVAKANLEALAMNYVRVSVLTDNITIDNQTLRLNILADVESDNLVGFSSYIEYENGIPVLVDSSKTLVSNQILISTGYDFNDWKDKISDITLGSGVNYAIQAIGTTNTYVVEIPSAGKIFTDLITVVNQSTQSVISILGEQSNLVAIDFENTENNNVITLNVNLAPVIALRDITVEIKVPYAEDSEAKKPSYVYSYYITPVLYTVEGFYLAEAQNNYLELTDTDVALELHAQVNYSEDVSVRNMVQLLLQSFETSVNNAIYNETLQFNIINSSSGVNVRLENRDNLVLIQKISDLTALNIISGSILIGYSDGMPRLGGINPLTDNVIDVQIQVQTQQGVTNYFPGWDNISLGHSTQFTQSVGTSRDYPLVVNDMNVVFYYEYIEVFNGGLKRGENQYEFFAFDVLNTGRQNLTIGFTLRATAKNLNDWIDVRIPYTSLVDGKTVWSYYSLQIKPILFEIRGWKLKVGDQLVDSISLDESGVELYFSPDIVSGPLNQSYYTADELSYINSAIKRLETEINTYDPKISDGYTYMVINNTSQEGYQVNYTIFRDNSSNMSYILRDSVESSTTIMQISANIAYGVNNFSKDYVDGVQAVTAYSNTANAQRISGQISIYTTDKTAMSDANNRSTVFISQDNAARLMNLSSGLDYVLMSDIYLYQISGLDNGKWKPVVFPSNSTLDGNNFKIYFTNLGFDLSGTAGNIGLFTEIPSGSVIKNLQVVITHGTIISPVTEVKLDLTDYEGGAVNIGLLAGINNGIITNCAVLSGWQFDMQNLTEVDNPVTGEKFDQPLPFNKDGYVYDDNYFYKLGMNSNNEPVITNIYNQLGYAVTKNDVTGKWDKVIYDIYMNVADWITPDRTNVARYDGYSPILFDNESTIDSKSSGKLLVYTNKNNENLKVNMGGLVGSNNHTITNSRVLVDVELWGPASRTDVGQQDECNIQSSAVGGVVGINTGIITTSYFRDGSVINNSMANTKEDVEHYSLLGGFVGQNSGTIQQSYAMGRSTDRDNNLNYISTAGAVKTIRNSLGGFVHVNSGTITDCLVNMVILKTGTEGYAGGFAFQNTSKGTITNCIENNDIILQSSSTLDYYRPFVVVNGDDTSKDKIIANKVVTTNLSNLIYAGNAEGLSFSDDWNGTLKHLSNNSQLRYADINNYEGFSIGQAQDDNGEWGITPDNTIWVMTNVGPMLREANEITISYRKYSWESSPYLYEPGSEKNPYLIWNEDQFNDYVYALTPHATEADKDAEDKPVSDIEKNRQNNHLRLVDNVTMTGIKDTYKIIYTGTFEGNGLTMSGISLDTVTNDLATMGLFGKTEYATIRNINFEVGNINSTARYVGGIAGIAINTNFIDVKVLGNKSSVIKGANIVGGFVGLNVINDSSVENYNLYSSVSVTANFHNQQTDVGAKPFSSGKEYYQQTLYAKVEAFDISYEQGFGTAGGVFGFVTANPNNYREVDSNGNVTVYAREFEKDIVKKDGQGNELAKDLRSSKNSEASWFLKDKDGNVIDDTVVNGSGKYYLDSVILRNVSGDVQNVSGNVAGGLIGIMDETIELRKPDLISLGGLTGKYYLGGLVGINLGKISGGFIQNTDGTKSTYSTMTLSKWSISSSAGSSYVFRDNPSSSETTRFWGMTVGAVAGYTDGFYGNLDSGVIENINVDVDLLSSSSGTLQYAIGGVVGGIGSYAYINNAINKNSNINFSGIRVTKNHVAKFGFYFGRIVGRGSASITSTTSVNSTTARITTVAVAVPYYDKQSYISTTDFATSDYYNNITNAFGVNNSETLKMQTMTLNEYKDYLKTVITGSGAGSSDRNPGQVPDQDGGSGNNGNNSDKYPGLDTVPGDGWEYDGSASDNNDKNYVGDSYVTEVPVPYSLTYTGYPQALVKAGDANNGTMEYCLYDGEYGVWSENIPTATNAGTYIVRYRVKGNTGYRDHDGSSVQVTINQADAYEISQEPSAVTGLTYNGSAMALVNAGSVTGGTMQYRVNDGAWSNNIPSAINAGTYNVYFRVTGDINHCDGQCGSPITVKIAQAEAFEINYLPSAKENLTYTGRELELVNDGSVTGGVLQYRLNDGNWDSMIPTATNAGTYTVYFRAKGDKNHQDGVTYSIDVVIAKASAYSIITNPTAKENLVYNGQSLTLIYSGLANGGELQYRLNDGNWSTDIPSAKEVGSYIVSYRIKGDSNHEDNNNPGLPVEIQILPENGEIGGESGDNDKENSIIKTAPVAKENLIYNGTDLELIEAGEAEGGLMEYRLATGNWSSSIPTGKNVGEYTVYYRVNGDAQHKNNVGGSVNVVIEKTDPYTITTLPTAKTSLIYTGGEINLINLGESDGGTLQYRLGTTGNWSTSAPIAINAGTYQVYYCVKGDENYNDSTPIEIEVTIAKAQSSVNSTPVPKLLTYNDSEQVLAYDGIAIGGTMQYSLDGENWSSAVPQRKNAGTYTLYYRVHGDINHEDYDGGYLEITISKASAYSITTAPRANTLTYNGKEQILIVAGQVKGGTMMYRLGDDGEWSSNLPVATGESAGEKTYVIYYMVKGDDNHQDNLGGWVTAKIKPYNSSSGSGDGDDSGNNGFNNNGLTSLDFNNKTLMERVDLLETLLDTLPTYVTTATINGETRWVEKYEENSVLDLLSYIDTYHVFDNWNNEHQIEGFSRTVKENYQSYIAYSAVSDDASEFETDFTNKLAYYREKRYMMAKVLFTYQYQVSRKQYKVEIEDKEYNSYSINGQQNALFTWNQYEEYLIFKNEAKSLGTDISADTKSYINSTFGSDLLSIIDPGDVQVAYYDGKNVTPMSTQSNNVFRTMLTNFDYLVDQAAQDSSKKNSVPYYTNKDPLQVYINYVTENAKEYENNAFRVNSSWKMSISQYYYYMNELYNSIVTYDYDVKNSNGGYTRVSQTYRIPTDFAATGNTGYVTYLYLNTLLLNTSQTVSIAKFIAMMKDEQSIVMQNELAWIKTGHLSGSTRISDIGAYTLEWNTGNWNQERENVTMNNGVIHNSNNSEQVWSALEAYMTAKATYDLTITKYKQIISMGGSLYELISDENYTSADYYIFTLQAEQYHWTNSQMNFIKTYYYDEYYNKEGLNVLNYPLAATTRGSILSATGSIRAVYKAKNQTELNSAELYIDNDNNGTWEFGEPTGSTILQRAGSESSFINGDGSTYLYGKDSITLVDEGGLGAAMYIDVNGDKLFTQSTGTGNGDILLLYEITDLTNGYDFRTDDNHYYNIVRQILQDDIIITNTENENSGNTSDYLEEALWWKKQGFSAEEFDQLKVNAFKYSVPVAGRYNYTNNTRAAGFTIADDWYWNSDKGSYFKNKFTTSEYTTVVVNSHYTLESGNYVWYSTYADYLLFNKIYSCQSIDDESAITGLLPSTSKFKHPFPLNVDTDNEITMYKFVNNLAPESSLSDALEFIGDSNHKLAYLALLSAGSNTCEYVNWANSYYYNVLSIEEKDKIQTPQYFRLNHYIYFVQNNMSTDEFSAVDYKWVLSNDVRGEIYYHGVTQESRTKDLVTYRRDWFNNGEPYITYRDYCEWINIYAYDDNYQVDRGDYEDPETGETTTSTDGWLTLDAFAVWKRMEKYENNVEYLAKITTTAGQDPIKAPIYKRKISTTVFPKISSSGEQLTNEYGIVADKNYVFPEKGYKRTIASEYSSDENILQYVKDHLTYYLESDYIDESSIKENKIDNTIEYCVNRFLVGLYNWGEGAEYKTVYENAQTMDPKHQRPAKDRFEYNERYTVYDIQRSVKIENYQLFQTLLDNASTLIQDEKFSKECDLYCGGLDSNNNPIPDSCRDYTHAAYQMYQWLLNNDYFAGNNYENGYLLLDDVAFTDINVPTNQYLQLYVPYENFKAACQRIKAVYSSSNGYKGYHNYMKYWAKNGSPEMICVYPSTANNEYPYDETQKDVTRVKNTFYVTNFWNNYDDTKKYSVVG